MSDATESTATDRAEEVAKEEGVDVDEVKGTGKDHTVTVKDVRVAAAESFEATDAAVEKASELGVDLTQVKGTNKDGSIGVKDVEKAAGKQRDKETNSVTYLSDRKRVLLVESADQVLNERGRVVKTLPRTALEFDANYQVVLLERDGKTYSNGVEQHLSFDEIVKAIERCDLWQTHIWPAGKHPTDPRPSLEELRDEVADASTKELRAIHKREMATFRRPEAFLVITDAALGDVEEPASGGSE